MTLTPPRRQDPWHTLSEARLRHIHTQVVTKLDIAARFGDTPNSYKNDARKVIRIETELLRRGLNPPPRPGTE